MGFLKNLSFGKKVLLIALLPFLGLMLLSTKVMFDAYARMVDSQQLRQLTEFATKASLLMHEMQNERGITAGFIGSEGEKFSSELRQQRQVSDQVLQSFNNYFQQATFLHSLGSLQEVADELQQKAQALNTLRQRTDQLKLPVDSVLRFYAQLNAALLKGVGEISHFTRDQISAMSYASYSDFLQAKERAGIERALLANAFEQDMFAYGEYDQFQKLKYEQDTYLTNFVRLASSDVRTFFQQTLTTDMVRSVEKFRDKAAHGAITDSSFGVTSEDWLSVASTRINALKEVDAYIAKAQQANAVASSEIALKTMFTLSIGVILSLLFSLLIGFFVLRTITRSVSVVKYAAEHIVEGDFSTEIPTGGKDEMGELLESFKAMQQNLEETAIRDKEQSDRFSRVKFALDHLSVNVMMADENHDIIYINKAIQKMFKGAESCIRSELPNFNADDILGKNIDVFHKAPHRQRNLLKGMTGSLKSEIQVGQAHLAFNATKVVNADGEFIGTVVEWKDRTQQVGIEADLQTIVTSAIAGDLSHRATTEGREGFFLMMAESINATLDKVSSVFNEVNETMACLSDGDLRRKIDSEYQGLYSEVKDNINNTVSKLESIVAKIHRTSNHIDNGSKEIVHGNENLAERTEEQVANIEETATSVEELTVSVQQNAKNAQHAKKLATTASKTAKDGGQVIERVINAMDDINKSSGKIVEIISVIDEIAFQTNLLALNAAVEAARAGEQGRGFAVVADEVQRLAQRSASAAQEIQNLIQDGVEKIKVGANLVGTSGDTLTQIVQAIDGVTHVVSEISGAVQEQANGIEQVNSSIARLDDMTQQNASLAQEASSVSHSMRDSADEMKDLVKHFTLS